MLTQARMRALTKGLPSKSAKMRALAKAGAARADIARFLGTRYAFVRNVLEAETARNAGFAEQPQAEYRAVPAPVGWRLRMVDGVVAIPAEALAAIGFTGEDDVMLMEFENDRELRAWSLNEAVRHAQEVTRPFKRQGFSVVDDFLADRRREAAREEREAQELRERLAKRRS